MNRILNAVSAAVIAAGLLMALPASAKTPAVMVIVSGSYYSWETPLNQYKSILEERGYHVEIREALSLNTYNPSLPYYESFKQYLYDYYHDNPTYDLKYVTIISVNKETTPGSHIQDLYWANTPNSYNWAVPDDWYTDFEGNDLIAEIPIGRLPFVNADELQNYVYKLNDYEIHRNDEWADNILITIDDTGVLAQLYPGTTVEDIREMLYNSSNDIINKFDDDYIVSEIRTSDYLPYPYYHYFDVINSGVSFQIALGGAARIGLGHTGYVEHYRCYYIAADYVLHPQVNPVSGLNNHNKYAFVFYPICYGGSLFDNPDREGPTFPEDWLRTGIKGGIGCLSPAKGDIEIGGGDTSVFSIALIDNITRNEIPIGDAVREAKIRYKNQGRHPGDMGFLSCELFCDPTLVLNLPHDNRFPVCLSGYPYYTQEPINGISAVTLHPPTQGIDSFDLDPYVPAATTPRDIVGALPNTVQAFDDGGARILYNSCLNTHSYPVTADITGEGLPEIIICKGSKLTVYNNDGDILSGFPKEITSQTGYYAPAVGDIDGDGYLDIVYATTTQIHVIDHSGVELTGWPKNVPGINYMAPVGSPAVGDLDNDGHLEIVVGTNAGSFSKIGCYNHDGSWHTGFSQETPATINEHINPPVLADVDEDNQVEIVLTANHPVGAGGGGSYIVYKHNGTEFRHRDYSYEFRFTPSVGDFVPTLEWDGKEVVSVAYADAYFKILVLDAENPDYTPRKIISLGNAVVTSSPTIADVNALPTNDVIIGCDDALLAYDLFSGQLLDDWDCPLEGDVTTPAVCDLDGNHSTDILCSDYEGVYAFTTDTWYSGIQYGGDCDWVRDGHDNLNMGLWDIAAPTGVAAADKPDDQGGVVVLAWTPSVDDGVRSNRVNGYKIYGRTGEIQPGLDAGGGGVPPAFADAARSRKLAEGKRAALMRGEAFASPALSSGDNPGAPPELTGEGGEMDTEFGLIDTVPAGTYFYETPCLPNGQVWEYYVVATDGTRNSQKSVTVQVTPHDNIAPAPPTNFAGVYNELDVNVHLTWDLSADDPYHEEGQPGDAIAGSPAGPGALSPFANRAGAPYSGNRGTAGASSGLDTAAYAGLPTDLAPSALGTVAGFGDEAAGMSDRQKEFLKKKIASALPGAPKGYYAPPPEGFPNYGRDGGANDVVQYHIVKTVNGEPNSYTFKVVCGTTELYDYNVSLGNVYTYFVYAADSENLSTAVGPVVIDLTAGGGSDAGGPVAAAPMDPLGAAFPDDPRRTSDPGNIAAGGFMEGGARPTSVITCRPNPIKGTATFQINVRKATRATLSVFDVSGRKVATVYEGPVPAGGMSATWKADVPNGIYLYTLETEEKRYSGKTAVLR